MKQLKISVLMLLLFTVITGLLYPLAVTGIGMALFRGKAGGSLVYKNGTVIGSALIGQQFAKPEYFHGRPSAVNYDSSLSGGSNLGPTNKMLANRIKEHTAVIRIENGLNEKDPVPDDLLFASGSGLDPHISVESARLQAARIAAERKMDITSVEKIIDSCMERQLPFYGRQYVNVLKLNMALDAAGVER